MMKSGKKVLLQKIIIVLFLIFVSFVCYKIDLNNSFGINFDLRWLDVLFIARGSVAPHPDIVVCTLDEETYDAMGDEYPFSSTSTYTKFFNNLKKLGVGVVGLDLIIESYKSDFGTVETEFRDSLKNFGTVVFAMKMWDFYKTEKLGGKEIISSGTRVKTSNDFYTTGHRLGMINASLSPDGVMRESRYSHVNPQTLEKYPTMVYKLYEAYLESARDKSSLVSTSELLLSGNKFLINFTGGPKNIPEVPFYSIAMLTDESIKKLRPKYEGKVFLIGATDLESHDFFSVPFSSSPDIRGMRQMSGVEVMANALNTLMSNNFIRQPSKSDYRLLFIIVAALASGTFFLVRSVWANMVLALAYCLVVLHSSYNVFISGGIFLRPDQICFTILALFFATVSSKIILLESEKRLIRNTFNRYISSEVVDKILSDGDRINLSGESSNVAVLFADIRNFTTISENLPAEAVVKILNGFFKRMVDVVFIHEGTLDKFIGDCVMVIFGAPQQCLAPVDRAVRCAIDMQRAAAEFNEAEGAGKDGKIEISVGIGISFGKCVVGNIGSEKRMEYTAIGDVVNTASRIQSLAGAREIFITSDANSRLQGEEAAAFSGSGAVAVKLDSVLLKGKTREVVVYRIDYLSEKAV